MGLSDDDFPGQIRMNEDGAILANGVGGIAGAALGGVLTWHFTDDSAPRSGEVFKAPFHLGVMPTNGGAGVNAFGEW